MILLWLQDNRRAAGADHQHTAVGTDRFIVEIDADNGIGAKMTSLLAHFTECNVFGLAQLCFIRRRTAAHDITNRCKEIPEDIRSENGISRDQGQILDCFLTVDTRSEYL